MRAAPKPSSNLFNPLIHVGMFFIFFLPAAVQAQSVGIGTSNPDASAQLDISNSSKGVLIPRMNTTDIPLIVSPAKGLMVYDSTTNKLMVNIGTATVPNWQPISSQAVSNGWNITGNAGLDAASNFIGTTDAVPLMIRVKNVRSGIIDSASSNTGFGFRTLDSISSGNHNTSLGYKSMSANREGIYNTGVGSNALRLNTSGSNNVGIGFQALSLNKTGGSNTALGSGAMLNNISASFNTAVGAASLFSNKAALYNTAMGYQSLYSTVNGNNNSAFGYNALNANQGGSNNVAIGDYAGYGGNGSYNSIIGSGAGINNTGHRTTLVGADAGSTNQVNGSVFVGASAGRFNINGMNNSFIGDSSGYANLSGQANTGLGSRTLFLNQFGSFNTAIGSFALRSNNAGNNNIAIGASSAEFTTGQENLMLGNNTGAGDVSGSRLSLIGHRANVLSPALLNATAIGANARVGSDNAISLGDSVQNTRVGIGTAYPDKAGLVVNQTVGPNVNAIFGSNTAGLAIESNAPAIGFNSYLNGSRKFIANGYAANMRLDPSTGVFYLLSNGNGNKDNVAAFDKGIQLLGSAAGANYLAPTVDNNFSLGTASFRWTSIYATNNIINTSDARQKKQIAPLQYGLKEILAMKPVSYQWINAAAGDQTMLGLLAQDVQKIAPEIVEENNGALGMRSAELIPILIKGMQEQQQKIDAMQQELELLKKMIQEKKKD